ncbi:hypothetical protein SK128_016470, partial [Halocaridina rubra]
MEDETIQDAPLMDEESSVECSDTQPLISRRGDTSPKSLTPIFGVGLSFMAMFTAFNTNCMIT